MVDKITKPVTVPRWMAALVLIFVLWSVPYLVFSSPKEEREAMQSRRTWHRSL